VNRIYGQASLLSIEECKEISNKINILKDYWTERVIAGQRLHTLGISAIADGPDAGEIPSQKYIEKYRLSNKILTENFNWLYKKLLDKVSIIYGEAVFMEDAPIPGFFIYGGKDGFSLRDTYASGSSLHMDNGFDRLGYCLNKYSYIDHNRYIAITLSIMLPEKGSGLIIWDEPDVGIYSNNTISEKIKSIKFIEYLNNEIFMKDNVINPVPNLVEYKEGGMLYMDSRIVHAVSQGVDVKESDQRITMQVFGIKCDDIWRLFF